MEKNVTFPHIYAYFIELLHVEPTCGSLTVCFGCCSTNQNEVMHSNCLLRY